MAQHMHKPIFPSLSPTSSDQIVRSHSLPESERSMPFWSFAHDGVGLLTRLAFGRKPSPYVPERSRELARIDASRASIAWIVFESVIAAAGPWSPEGRPRNCAFGGERRLLAACLMSWSMLPLPSEALLTSRRGAEKPEEALARSIFFGAAEGDGTGGGGGGGAGGRGGVAGVG